MILTNKSIIHFAQYAAPYEGNFIKSLKYLEANLKEEGAQMVYVFPTAAERQPWYAAFEKSHTVFLADVGDWQALRQILTSVRPDIIHCHFEGYDVATHKIIKQEGIPARIVWHLHDAFSFLKNPLKNILVARAFWEHYCRNAGGVSVIGVCDEVVRFVSRFKRLSGRDFYRKQTILNGIDLSRVAQPEITDSAHRPLTFLTFGGRNIQKRVDVVFKAFERLFERKPDAPYRLLITSGTDTMLIINNLTGGG